MSARIPGEDEQPATRRDLQKERDIIESNTRAGFAEVRTAMGAGFRKADNAIAELRVDMTEGFRKTDSAIAELRVDMTEGFRKTDQAIAKLRAETTKAIAEVSGKVDRRMTNQTRFLVGLMITLFGVLLAAVLQTA